MQIVKPFLFSMFLFFCLLGFSQTIYQWRGFARDGIYQEKQLFSKWPDGGPELLWTADNLGNGYGSPVITSENIYINGEIDSTSQLFAFDLEGKLLWKSPNGKEFTGNGFSSKFPGCRSTPTVVGDLVYSCSGNGRIACFEKQTGSEKWAVDMVNDLKGIMPSFGYSESLALDDKRIFCYPGGVQNNVVALNRLTGKILWASKALSDTACYTSPLIITLPIRKILVTFSIYHFFGLDAETGELLWSRKLENVKNKMHSNTPVYADGFIYYLTGDDDEGIVKLELSPDGKSIKEIWKNGHLRNSYKGFVKINENLFGCDRSKKAKCIDINTGLVVDSLMDCRGALISANNMLYCYSDNGNMNLIKMEGPKMEIISKFKCEKGNGEHFSHPVISDGLLYIRHGRVLMAYKIK